jgi:hypothetical protein
VRMPHHITRPVLIVPFLLAAGVVTATPVTAAARARPASPASSLTISGSLRAVAVTSARDAWAVGSAGTGTLIVHWNGRTWKRVASPSPARASSLSGIDAISARNAWAVGSTSTRALILHWNGRTWKKVPSPGGYLSGVAATSARSAWAVGGYGISVHTLILRWNGKSWKRVPSPSPGAHFYPFLQSIATSARRTWAVGDSTDCGCGPGVSLILRWNGRARKRVASPTPGGGTDLSGVAAASASSAWAVGLTGEGTSPTKTLILRWNGMTWKKVPSPAPRANSGLSGVATTSAGRAWAVGFTSNKSRNKDQTLILQWNGTTWK